MDTIKINPKHISEFPNGLTVGGVEVKPGAVRTATVVVAASDSLNKDAADFICDATNFETQMAAAIGSGGLKLVMLAGNYVKSTVTAIPVHSDTEIEIISGATIAFADGLDADAQIFANSDPSGGNSKIWIHGGGILDGNRTNQTSGEQSAIKFTNVEQSVVDISMKNFRSYHVHEVNLGHGNIIINREFPNVVRNEKSPFPSRYWRPLSSFETNWTTTGGTMTYDTDRKFRGTRSAKIITPGATGNNKGMIEKTFSPPMDFTNAEFSLKMYTEDAMPVDVVEIYLRSGGNWSQFQLRHMQSAIEDYRTIDDMWHGITTHMELTFGSFDISAVDLIRVSVVGRDTDIATVWLDDLCYFPLLNFPNGAIVFTIDDGYISTYTRTKAVLDKYNYGALVTVLKNQVDGNPEYVNIPQLHELQDCGWDIGCHSTTHMQIKDGVRVIDSTALIEEEALTCQDWLIRNGFKNGARFYSYPNGYHSKKYLEVMEKYFIAARLADNTNTGGVALPFADNRTIQSMCLSPAAPPARIKGYMDIAKAQNKVLVLYLHQTVESGASGQNEYNIVDFEEIVDYCYTQNMAVLTFSDIYDNIDYRNQCGTATLANGTIEIDVPHGLPRTPSAGEIMITPIEAWGNMTQFRVGNYTTTHFTIYADINPGQPVDFAWKATVQ